MQKKSLENLIANSFKKFGKLCLNKRRKLNIPINKLAEKAEVSLGALSSFENGTAIPSAYTLFAVTNALGLQNELCDMLIGITLGTNSQKSSKELEKTLISSGLPPEKVSHVLSYIEFLKHQSSE